MHRTIVIGDIHACHDELMDLLDKVALSDDDEVIALGDIFDRGPNNTSILQLFSENPQFSAIKGNHERKHLLFNEGLCRPAISQLITRTELGDEYPALLDFARNLPAYRVLDDAILVHGAIEPGVPMNQQKETVLVSSMSGFRHLVAKYTRPWYELIDADKPVLFGHETCQEPFVYDDRIFGLDTGCCHGGNLTAMVLPEFNFVSVPSRENHWDKQRERYQVHALGANFPGTCEGARINQGSVPDE